MKKFNTILFLLISLFIVQTIDAQTLKRKFNSFSGTLQLTIEGGATYGMTDYKEFTLDYLGKSSLEYYFPTYTKSSFGIKLFGGFGFLKGESTSQNPKTIRTNLTYGGAGIIYTLGIGESFFPYVSAGGSYLFFDPKDENGNPLPNNAAGNYKKSEFNIIGELGMKIMLAENLSFNLNTTAHLSPNDWLDDKVGNANNDLFLVGSAGFSFVFFSERDSDGDGIVDSKDLCPDTPRGVKVDEFGCPKDSDGDGVPDYLDKCPDTPQGVPVDKDGCPLDSDGDGISDYIDICPNTPKGVEVDEFGCPIDSDGDGVPDYLDKCPNTPRGVAVDKDGCPRDSDGDGVPDYLDKCPNTPQGVEVDENGCPKEKEVIEVIREVVLSAGANFAIGKADLLPSAYPDLDKLIEVMKENPATRWRIEGHTDNTGSAKLNKELSLKRAQAVLNYFISKGLDKNRFQVFGMGMDFPVADNSNETGRALNRRVVILRID